MYKNSDALSMTALPTVGGNVTAVDDIFMC